MRLNRTAGAACIALVLALVAGCGSSRSGDGATNTPKAGAETTTGKFGDLPTPCGAGDAKGATDQGVTDTDITIGYGDDRGFSAAPGLDQEVGDAVSAMIKWCNEQGGINGRKIVGHQYDAAYLNAPAQVQKSCATDFMLVGQGFAMDEQAEQFRVACHLPTVPAFVVGPNASMGPDKFEPLPFPADAYNAEALALEMEKFPAFKSGPGEVLSDSPAIKAAMAKVNAGLKALGTSTKDCGITISQMGEANYMPFAEKFKSCGAETVWTSNGAIPSQFGFLSALKKAGVKTQVFGEAQWYGEAAAQWNGEWHAGDGLVAGLMVQPLENADLVPAVKQYLDVVKASGGKTSMLGIQATSAFLLWATVAKQCGSDLTRKCMVTGLEKVHEWTGGGLHAPTDPGGNMPTDCALLVQLEGKTWKQIAPEKRGEFTCDKANVVKLDPKLSGVTLNSDRISTAFLKG
jgi:ABC-type branched-subunit amino acid transport system substrate-binding protein